jgi:hypothetical protein
MTTTPPTRRLAKLGWNDSWVESTGTRTHKRVLKVDGSADTLPLPPIVVAAVWITRQLQADRRTAKWPKVCICGERHQLLFTTSTGPHPGPRSRPHLPRT